MAVIDNEPQNFDIHIEEGGTGPLTFPVVSVPGLDTFISWVTLEESATFGPDFFVSPGTSSLGFIQLTPGTTFTINVFALLDDLPEDAESFTVTTTYEQRGFGNVVRQVSNYHFTIPANGGGIDFASSLPDSDPPPEMDWGSSTGSTISSRFEFDPDTEEWRFLNGVPDSEWVLDDIKEFGIAKVVGGFHEEAEGYLDAVGERFGVTRFHQQVQEAEKLYNAMTNLHTGVFAAISDGLEGNIEEDEVQERVDSSIGQFIDEETGATEAADLAAESVGVGIIEFIFDEPDADGLLRVADGGDATAAAAGPAESFRFTFSPAAGDFLGSAGVDWLVGGRQGDVIRGRSGDDTLLGLSGNDSLFGDAGNDLLAGGPGDDSFAGGLDADTVSYSNATQEIRVNLTLAGRQNTGQGNDSFGSIEDIIGSDFADTLTGQNALNFFRGGAGNDFMHGGSGIDTLFGEADADLIVGDAGNDIVDGGSGNDRLYGGTGDDEMFGGEGADTVAGGPGSDRLDGGIGPDRLYADGTADTFVFQGIAEAGDRIIKFQSGLHRLEIDAEEFGGVAGFFTFRAGPTPATSTGTQALLYDTDDGKLFIDPDGTGPTGRIHILTLIGAPVLAASDIDFV